MTSKYGGIPLEDEGESRYGGIPVDQKKIAAKYQADELTENGRIIAEELQRRGAIDLSQKEQLDEPGILDYLMGLGEVGTTLATGAIAEPVSGIIGAAVEAGLAPGVSGPKAIKRTQEALTMKPTTEAGQRILGGIGKAIQPVVEPITKGVQAVSDIAYEAGGPAAGAATKAAIAAIPEILGLKGTRAAKKAALGKMVEGQDITGLYNEVGDLLPEIRRSIDEAGITMDEIKDVLPENIIEEGLPAAAERVGEAAAARVRPGAKIEELVEDVNPSPEIVRAAEDLGVSDRILASHTSQNPTYVAIEQGLKSIPGSILDAREKALIADLSQKADDLIVEFGGTIDKSLLSDKFRADSRVLISNLENQASQAFDKVNSLIPRKTEVTTPNLSRFLFEEAESLGGIKYLSKQEQKLLRDLDPRTNPTYARLDMLRKEIGSGIKSNTGRFKDADAGRLKKIYGELSKDQKNAANSISKEAGDLYTTANELVISRKGIEDQLTQSIGKELSGSITDKARPAMLDLQKGSTKRFDELIESIPEGLDADIKKQVVATALNDAFVQGARKTRQLNVSGFNDFMTGLKRNKGAYNRLKEQLGSDSMKRLETFHTLISGIDRALSKQVRTGLIQSVPGMVDEVNNIASRVYGTAKKVARNVPGMASAGAIETAINSAKNARSVSADALLSSPRFRDLIIKKASGKLDTQKKIDRADQAMKKIKQYKEWEKTLDKKTLDDLANVGILGYLTGETLRSGE